MNYYAVIYECQDTKCKSQHRVFISTEHSLMEFGMYKPFCCKECGHDEFYVIAWFDITNYVMPLYEEIASLQEAAAEKDSVIEAQSEKLGEARNFIRELAMASAAHHIWDYIVRAREMQALWQAAEVETAE